ncbi:MAG: hypothetical protein Q9164_007192, partial [Protoblastenia rupestris]
MTRSEDALNSAIDNELAAVVAFKENERNHAGQIRCKHSLQAHFSEKYRRHGVKNDLKSAISFAQDVVDGTPQNDPYYVTHLASLAGLFFDSHLSVPSDMTILDEAVRLAELCVDLNSADNLEQADMLSNLSFVYHRRFQITGSANDLKEAIKRGDAAVIEESEYGLEQAMKNLGKALRLPQSPPLERIKAGKAAADIAISSENWDEAALYLTESIDLLPWVALRSKSREDYRDNLKQVSNLGSRTASVLLKAQKSALISFQVLEKARGVISSLVLDSGSDISSLKEQHPDLCSTYCALRKIIATSIPPKEILYPAHERPSAINEVSMFSRRTKDIQELKEVEDKIRKQPGFERFQLAPTEKEICELAQEGPIVSYNITEVGSHAFLITAQAVQVLPLPQFSITQLKEHIEKMPTGNRSRRDAKAIIKNDKSQIEGTPPTKLLEESMRSLWEDAVEPVLSQLGLLRPRGCTAQLPCIWWVGGGLMLLLPLHVAGNHQDNPTDNTMSHVVSSYMPTLKTLRFSRNKTFKPLQGDNYSILIVAMPQTPDSDADSDGDLHIDTEVENIRQHVESSASVDILDRPTRDQVLERIQTVS